ncbi:dual OB domain-containing protein [Bacillus thuringiensis]|uniref:dual OB domain-containing protein n=1 Tax=Bacillus thuringiensis TaxID=1428 RepID=UPI000E2F47D7|nr:hypothetical protein [Bacillus thuringiensis]RFB53680.1 hypothetical protein DZB90_24780 [Bacillus thuringiensis]
MECVITGLTKMNGGRVCMSLYDRDGGRYIRPLKDGNTNFTETDLIDIELFSIVEIEERNNESNPVRPHVEDTVVSKFGYYKPNKVLSSQEIRKFLATISSISVNDLFGYDEEGESNLVLDNRNWGLRPNTGMCSLGTVEVEWLEVYRDSWGKVRIDFRDKGGATYTHVPLVMKATNEEIQSLLGEYDENDFAVAYLRLSLARPYHSTHWEDTLCALQVSNINIF